LHQLPARSVEGVGGKFETAEERSVSDKTKIEWTDSTWQVTRGCTRVSEGCKHCYAERIASRFDGPGKPFEGLIHPKTNGWNGKVITLPQNLQIPWRWSKGRNIFVNSMSDLFHEDVPFEFIAAVFWVMSVTTRHTYQVLTKRPERMLAFFEWLLEKSDCGWPLHHQEAGWYMTEAISDASDATPEVKALGWTPWREGKRHGGYDNCGPGWPYENVWLGVSVEDQATADERIPLLLRCPAAVRFLSCEPLLGPIDLTRIPVPVDMDEPVARCNVLQASDWTNGAAGNNIDWVIAGGESGPGARPMQPDWARSLRDQCAAGQTSTGTSIPFFFKQWGEYLHETDSRCAKFSPTKSNIHLWPDDFASIRVGKLAAGRLLDGNEHNAIPERIA
jgi:protein gp37